MIALRALAPRVLPSVAAATRAASSMHGSASGFASAKRLRTASRRAPAAAAAAAAAVARGRGSRPGRGPHPRPQALHGPLVSVGVPAGAQGSWATGHQDGSPLGRSRLTVRGASSSAQCSGAGSGTAAAALFQYLRQERQNFAAAQLPELPSKLRAGLQAHLDELSADDLQVSPLDAAAIRSRSGIGYQEVYAGQDMTLCVFVLRAGARIPLHDHPGMHVYGRLLFGRMRALSFDFEPSTDGPRGGRWATLHSEMVLGPEPTTYSLGPNTGNLHELEAMEDSAFFDVLTPPYDMYMGRDCTYYRREEAADDDGRYVLTPVNMWGFSMQTLQYRGPAVGL